MGLQTATFVPSTSVAQVSKSVGFQKAESWRLGGNLMVFFRGYGDGICFFGFVFWVGWDYGSYIFKIHIIYIYIIYIY